MSITLHMTHTFSTRHVISSKELEEMRDQLEDARLTMEARKLSPRFNELHKRDQAKINVGIQRCNEVLALDDEEFCVALVKQAMRDTFRDDVASNIKRVLFATDVSPIKTLTRESRPKGTCEGCKRADVCGQAGENVRCRLFKVAE